MAARIPNLRPIRPGLRAALSAAALLSLVAACGGGGGDAAPTTAPANLTYDVDPGLYRAGEPITDNNASTTGGAPTSFTVNPPLPSGLVLNAVTGTIGGTPTVETPGAAYTVTAANSAGQTQTDVTLAIGKPLPGSFVSLKEGFEVECVLTGLNKGARIALLPDGRILYTEVSLGRVRVIDANGTLQPAPYLDLLSFQLGGATVDLLQGSHQGLLGLAIAPDFNASGHVFVSLTIGEQGQPDRMAVLRFTDDPTPNANQGTDMQVVLDDLPTADTNCGGELLFEPDPGGVYATDRMWVSVGDAENSLNAQAPIATTPAGKILRIIPTTPATLPPENTSGTLQYANGCRAIFGMGTHPTLGGLFVGDNGGMDLVNGHDMLDEVNYVIEGNNYGWGSGAGGNPLKVKEWTNVTVVPAGLTFHTGAAFSTTVPPTDSLFVTAHLTREIFRFVMSGVARTDVDLEEVWAQMTLNPNDNPLDIVVDPVTDDLYVITFGDIWRISAITP